MPPSSQEKKTANKVMLKEVVKVDDGVDVRSFAGVQLGQVEATKSNTVGAQEGLLGPAGRSDRR